MRGSSMATRLQTCSVCQTADAGSPRLLSRYIAKEIGKGKGLLGVPMASFFDRLEIRYVPQYVLTQDQVSAVGRGALAMIDKLNGTGS